MNNTHRKKVAAIDLDDCLISTQSGNKLIKYLFKKGKISMFFYIQVYIWFIGYKIGMLSNVEKVYVKAVEFAKGLREEELKVYIDDFYNTVIKFDITDKALSYLQKLKQEGYTPILISNSIQPFVSHIGKKLNIELCFGTKLKLKNGVFTGKIDGVLMYGEQKALTLTRIFKEENIDSLESTALSDHFSDIPMLQLVGKPIAVNPKPKLLSYAQKKNWPVIYF